MCRFHLPRRSHSDSLTEPLLNRLDSDQTSGVGLRNRHRGASAAEYEMLLYCRDAQPVRSAPHRLACFGCHVHAYRGVDPRQTHGTAYHCAPQGIVDRLRNFRDEARQREMPSPLSGADAPPLSISPEPRQSLPEGPDRLHAPLTSDRLPTATTDMESMVLEHGFGVTRLNTGTMTLAATLLANFRTIHFPRSEDRSIPTSTTRPDWWAKAKARCADRLAVDTCRQRLRRELVAHDHRRFLDHIEFDPEGGRRLHIFVADDHALSIVAKIAGGQCGAGDPVDFDPEEFVADQLHRLEGFDSDFE